MAAQLSYARPYATKAHVSKRGTNLEAWEGALLQLHKQKKNSKAVAVPGRLQALQLVLEMFRGTKSGHPQLRACVSIVHLVSYPVLVHPSPSRANRGLVSPRRRRDQRPDALAPTPPDKHPRAAFTSPDHPP